MRDRRKWDKGRKFNSENKVKDVDANSGKKREGVKRDMGAAERERERRERVNE